MQFQSALVAPFLPVPTIPKAGTSVPVFISPNLASAAIRGTSRQPTARDCLLPVLVIRTEGQCRCWGAALGASVSLAPQ